MRDPIIRLKERRTQGQHAGLLLQRYLCENATGENGNPEEKRAIFAAAIYAAANAEVRELYRLAFERWKKSLPELRAANELRTQGRIIVGLGSENVLETGITLHHTYGMPIIPGSALKGLAAHYCDQVWGANNKDFKLGGEFHRVLFGKTDESGCIIFHDAWFDPDSERKPLKTDVMTPHHPKWNDLENPVAPTDFDSPVPVPFLSVAGKFYVAVSWHGPDDYEKSVAWTTLAFELARAALAEWGVGGKTSSGYGRLEEVDPGKRKMPFSARGLGLPSVGDTIEATLLKAPKKADQPWRAEIPRRTGKPLAGPIDGNPPAGIAEGKKVQLIVTEIDERSIKYKWPQGVKK
jgi:CRISPR-associated protein Cmr6